MKQIALDFFYLLGYALALPWAGYRMLRGRGWPWGSVGVQVDARPGGVWLHGSSVGEVSLIQPLVELIEQRFPHLDVVISSHTRTGVAAARRAFPSASVFRFPLDFSWLQRRLLRRLAPTLVIVVESDLWPNHLLAARREGIPVAVVNAKLSDRSCRLHRMTRIVPRALRDVAVVAVQTAGHADRFASLGLDRSRIHVTGNMKYDLAVEDDVVMRRSSLRSQLGFADDDVVIIGGSLHPQEDKDLLAAYLATRAAGRPTRLVIVPRYPEQAGDVVSNALAAGCQAVLKSVLDANAATAPGDDRVIVVDTLGELRQLYAAADIAFVGGSLYFRGANKGGHNLMEPAVLGLPVIFGPHNFSFRETVADLLAAEAGFEVADRAALVDVVEGLATSAERRTEIGRRGREVVLARRGASLRNLELVSPLLERAGGCRRNPEDAQCRHQTPDQLFNE